MKRACLLLPPVLLLAGCGLLPTTRRLPVPKAPQITQVATPEQLVDKVNQSWAALSALTATVEIKATETKVSEGVVKDFPSCRGFIVMRKPEMMRVAGTYFGVKIFDMASDGNHFTLVVPHSNMAFEGSNNVRGTSPNPLYNLRPGFFFDAVMVRGLDPDDFYTVTAETDTVEDAAKKHLYEEPEYVLSVTRHNNGSHIDTPVRVITFNRDDLLPYQQDLYDEGGNLQTQISYGPYSDFNGVKYPSTITINRPLDGIKLVLTVERVIENPDPSQIKDSQFQVAVPEGMQVKQLP